MDTQSRVNKWALVGMAPLAITAVVWLWGKGGDPRPDILRLLLPMALWWGVGRVIIRPMPAKWARGDGREMRLSIRIGAGMMGAMVSCAVCYMSLRALLPWEGLRAVAGALAVILGQWLGTRVGIRRLSLRQVRLGGASLVCGLMVLALLWAMEPLPAAQSAIQAAAVPTAVMSPSQPQ